MFVSNSDKKTKFVKFAALDLRCLQTGVSNVLRTKCHFPRTLVIKLLTSLFPTLRATLVHTRDVNCTYPIVRVKVCKRHNNNE